MTADFSQPRDFLDETLALHALVAPLPEAALAEPTGFKGWSIAEIVGHLHVWNWGAALSLRDPAGFEAVFGAVRKALAEGRSLRDFERDRLSHLQGRARVDAWLAQARETAAQFAAADPSARVKWAGPDMSVRSSISARHMETWAHGQAIHDVLGVVREDTDRIRNVAVLGINAYDWSFKVRGEAAPLPKPHVRLAAPSGAIWTWNPPSDESRIDGDATEFCQVVTQTRNVADTRLSIHGAAAAAWMASAQCFAGPPETPPAPGLRHTARRRPGWAR